ncbi:Protein kinase C and casein kinase substrate in neuron protein 1, partial [Taenia solium]
SNFKMSSMKDKFSRKVRITFARTEQKLRPSRNPKNESDIDTLEQFHSNVKEQKSLVRKLTEQWKKYLIRTQEAEKAAAEFEYTLLRYLSFSEETRNNNERFSAVFPSYETCDLEIEFKEMMEQLDVASKTIKDTEALKRNYLANQNVYEKANDQKKEQERQAVEESRKRLGDSIRGLHQCIPQILTKNDEELYECRLKYLNAKYEYLDKMLSETKNTINELKDARTPSSASSKCFRSSFSQSSPPGCQATSDGSTTKDATYSQPSRPPPKSAANGHEAQGMRLSTDLTYTNSDSRRNGAGASTRDQASNELTSHTPPFDVIATFAYTSEEQDELGFEVNDRITVLPWEDSEDEEPGWLYGKHQESGLKGLFPANYVKLA